MPDLTLFVHTPQRLIARGRLHTGIVACDTFDYDIIDRIYRAFDNLTLSVTLNGDGTTSREILASVAEAVKADAADASARLKEVFRAPSLKMVSFMITEQGYALRGPDGNLLRAVGADLAAGPASARHAMSVVCALLKERFDAGGVPLAVVSMDNCSHNGEKLRASVLEIADGWAARGFVGADFLAWIRDGSRVAFPWTMIDKITPRPHARVLADLQALGVEGMAPIVTSKDTYIAPFVNAERSQYLVVEDAFPNGRPPLEEAGVYMADRDTVNRTEKMKVATCLNPLHTAMSVYGCLFGYTLICDEMKDPDIVRLVRRLGYVEGLPVAVDPGILSPKAFLDDVIAQRLPNPFMPDAPRRIATDTSQKVGVRFGETVKSYLARGCDLGALVALPLTIAGWFRYLGGTDDAGAPMAVSSDPLRDALRAKLAAGGAREILANASIFGLDLTATPLADRILGYYARLQSGPGAARALLRAELGGE